MGEEVAVTDCTPPDVINHFASIHLFCYTQEVTNIEYLFQGELNNTVHEITYDQLREKYEDNKCEEEEGKRITESFYRGENFYDGKNDQMAFYREYLYRDPKTAGYRTYYPHGVVIEQSMRRNYYRGENRIYPESIPTLLRKLKKYATKKDKELYRMVADMRIAEFKVLLDKFDHVKNWNYCDVLYDVLAQHYGLETGWLDITNDFNVALFFATCFWRDGEWHPLTQEMIDTDYQYGMIFHMPSNRMSMRWHTALEDFSLWTSEVIGVNEKGEKMVARKELPSICRENGVIYPLGFQPFMRCHMQSSYGMYMREPAPLQHNFEFEKLKFKQSVELSQRIFKMMDGGKKIYPHEGLGQAQFIIDEIRELTTFSVEAFEYALYRNHYYKLEDKKQCLNDLQEFSIDGERIKIVDYHPWKISSGRRKRIDTQYSAFSLEKDYGIMITERKQIPGPSPMFEPWMLRSAEDEPGVTDFKVREKVECGDSIASRNRLSLLATMMEAKLQDF